MGNINAVVKTFERIGCSVEISKTTESLLASDSIILPGVGSFDAMVSHLQKQELIEPIKRFAKTGKLVVGICLGAEVLLDSSEEGILDGLALIKGTCRSIAGFSNIQVRRVPHVGWSSLKKTNDSKRIKFDYRDHRVYFSHSYFLDVENPQLIDYHVDYGIKIPAIIESDNILGIQFHPEKSGQVGQAMLQEIFWNPNV